MNRICIILSCLCLIISGGTAMPAQERTLPVSGIVMDFEPVCDTLDSLAYTRLTVKVDLELKAVMRRGNSLDFYFTRSLGDCPWRSDTYRWFRESLKELFPQEYSRYDVRISSLMSIRCDIPVPYCLRAIPVFLFVATRVAASLCLGVKGPLRRYLMSCLLGVRYRVREP